MGTVRIAQRSFASGELDEKFSGLADVEQYARGLRRALGVILTPFGTVQKKYGSLQLAAAAELIPRMVALDIPGEGAKVLEIGQANIKAWDASTRTEEGTVAYGSVWDSGSDVLLAVPVPFGNQVWFFHPDQPTMIVERDAAGNWTATSILDKTAFVHPLLDPRPLSTTLTTGAGPSLTAGTSYFRPSDVASNGSLWFIGKDSVTNNSGWFRATQFVSETILNGAVGDWAPSNMTTSDWSGPWKQQGTFANTINTPGAPGVGGDLTVTLTGGDTTSATDVGSIISLSQNVRLLLLIRKVASSTTYDCRVIDANGGTLAASYAGTHDIWRPQFREYDGNYLMPDFESGNSRNLFSFEPIMAAGMSAATNQRDCHFQITEKSLTRVTAFVDINNVTVNYEEAIWAGRDLAPRIEYSPRMCDYYGYPGTGTIHQGRVVMSAVPRKPTHTYWSKTNQPLNFKYGSQDDDAFQFQIELARGSISWMASAQDLLVGTTLAEYAVRGSPVTPSNVKADLQTTYGGLRDTALIVGGAAIFVTRCGCGLREMAFRFETDRFAAPDLTDLNKLWSPLASGATIFRQPAYVREPDPLLFAIGDSGELTCLTYRRDNNVIGWSKWRLPLKAGEAEANRDQVISIAAVPTSTERDELWISTRRYLNGSFSDFIEIVSDAAIWDAETTVTSPGSTTITGLTDYATRQVAVVADGVWLGYYTVSAGGSIDLSNHLGSPPTTVILGYEGVVEIDVQVLQADQRDGASDGRRRTIKDALLNLVSSFGGEIGFIAGTDGGSDVEQFSPIFPEIVEGTTTTSESFSGVKKVPVNQFGEDPRPRVRAKGPWGFQVSAVSLAVEIGD